MEKWKVILVGNMRDLNPLLRQALEADCFKVFSCLNVGEVIKQLQEQGASLLIADTSKGNQGGSSKADKKLTNKLAERLQLAEEISSFIKSDERTFALPIVFVSGQDHALRTSYGAQIERIVVLDHWHGGVKALISLLEEIASSGRAKNWLGNPLTKISYLPSKDFDRGWPNIQEEFLVDRIINREIRILCEAIEPHKRFLDKFFQVMSQLVDADLMGLAVTSLQNPWLALMGKPGLKNQDLDNLLLKIEHNLLLTQKLSIESDLKTSESGESLGQTKLISLPFDSASQGLLIFANYEDKQFTSRTSLILNQLEVLIRPLFKLLYAQQEIHSLRTKAAYNASVDPFTGLYNLEFLIGFLQQQLLFSFRQKLPVGLLIIDIDNFATINQNLGLEVGDVILSKLAGRLLSITRSSDLIARYGGDEFAIVLPNTDIKGAKVLASKIHEDIAEADFFEDVDVTKPHLAVSIGCAQFDLKDLNPEKILSDAKHSLQRAKARGKNCTHP